MFYMLYANIKRCKKYQESCQCYWNILACINCNDGYICIYIKRWWWIWIWNIFWMGCIWCCRLGLYMRNPAHICFFDISKEIKQPWTKNFITLLGPNLLLHILLYLCSANNGPNRYVVHICDLVFRPSSFIPNWHNFTPRYRQHLNA